MTHMRRRTVTLALALLTAITLAVALPLPAFALPDTPSQDAYHDDYKSGRRCNGQCGW